MEKAGKKYNQWLIQNADGLYYKSDITGTGWVANPYQGAFYNYDAASKIIPILGIGNLKVADGIKAINLFKK